ncbi:MAG TPA: putative glycoside hydrolase, partial [Treponemataceae bacterium]|nr:putative glycoside hydrolase [Treponemataceae bacterium]
DKSLASWGGGRYAVWDKNEKKSWQGYELVTQKVEVSAGDEKKVETEVVRKYYDEFWVDPYSEEVWEYNVAIAKELIARGFDEIQFDYIRFPTDGTNLGNASFRWQDAGMDKESALMSFLSYARKEIRAPISIDIYGANGWYRTGARTGQDVELLSRYVDAICPMFYPSHFEQSFLAQAPAEERPYRVFYYGSFRNAVIAHGRSIVRPWAQAFYLNVSYDRAFYDGDYVQKQVYGVRDSIDQGYTYWNNSGRYGDLRPDIGPTAPYAWKSPEAGSARVKPAFGGR